MYIQYDFAMSSHSEIKAKDLMANHYSSNTLQIILPFLFYHIIGKDNSMIKLQKRVPVFHFLREKKFMTQLHKGVRLILQKMPHIYKYYKLKHQK